MLRNPLAHLAAKSGVHRCRRLSTITDVVVDLHEPHDLTNKQTNNNNNHDNNHNPLVAVVTLSRPQRMNALSFDMGHRIRDLSHSLPASVRAIVFAGHGNSFSTGRDLKDSHNHTPEEKKAYMDVALQSVLSVRALPIPTIAALNGFAFGWGMELAVGCDLRVAASNAVLCFPETGLGIFPGAGGTVLLPRIVGEARAKELIFTAKRFTGKDAADWGLVNQLAESSDDTRRLAFDLASTIALNGPLGVQAAKRVVDATTEISFTDHVALSNELRYPLNATEDFAEALAAFGSGKPPVFKGR